MFQSIRARRPKRNKFNLSHERKLSCNMGDLVPIFLEEIVPGDKFRVSAEIMMRLAPMLAPVMHRVNVWTHFFFVPNRLIWNEWEDFITGGEDGLQAPVHPHYTTTFMEAQGRMLEGSLADYFGLPILTAPPVDPINISALPFRAYTEIFNEYYRDQNLSSPTVFSKASGVTTDIGPLALRRRCWEKDYLTSALPFAQRGNPVTIPGQATYLDITEVYNTDGTTPASVGRNLGVHNIDAGDLASDNTGGSSFLDKMQIQNLEEIGIDINDLRTSNALQKWLELAARGGSRYIEQIKNFFGVVSSDARLQRPEYLGGGKQNVVISEVLQTSQTDTGTPLGEMAGHGVSVGSTNRFARSFEEHGFVIGIMSVLPRTAYQNGVDRFWRRSEKFDYYFPQFAHLGEQEILNSEVFYGDADSNYDDTFGYQSRYAEYKHRSSKVSGDFRSSLNFYHMGRIFTGIPFLNDNFVLSDPTHRIFANTETTDHKLWVQIFNRVDALRPMPYYGTPRL